MVLKPQDVLVAAKAAHLEPGVRFTFAEVARSLVLSRSEVHAAVRRCFQAKLMAPSPEVASSWPTANRTNLLEFLIHGVKYAFPPTYGGVTRGVPTGYAAPVLRNYFPHVETLPLVWPDPLGTVRGRAFEPLYPSVPRAASLDASFYEVLALIDAVRGGRARDREIAERLLGERLARPRGEHDERQPRHA